MTCYDINKKIINNNIRFKGRIFQMKKRISALLLLFLFFSILPMKIFAANVPIKPWDYAQKLGKGLDVDWSKTKEGKEAYNSQTAKDFSDMGIKHVRIRIKDDMTDESFKLLDKQIKDCLDNNIIPIIAYQADELKNDPSDKNLKKVVKWWGKTAEHYKDYPYLLSFDLIIEVTDALNKEPERLNEIYEEIVSEVRKTNSKRILMISPLNTDGSMAVNTNIGGYNIGSNGAWIE